MNASQPPTDESGAQNPVQTPSDTQADRIAIIGGGIAGLFCAYILANNDHTVELFESSDVLGGRIRSFRFNDTLLNEIEREDDDERTPVKDEAVLDGEHGALRPALLRPDLGEQILTAPLTLKKPEKPSSNSGDNVANPSHQSAGGDDPKGEKDRGFTPEDYDKHRWDHLEFNAEFGPMRIELEVQRMLDFLLNHLGIPPLHAGPPEKVESAHDLVRMERFPPFSSPPSAGDPVYNLKPEEEGKDPLELLKLGVCRAVVDLYFDIDQSPSQIKDFEDTRKKLTEKLNNAAATQRPSAPVFESWLRNHLHEDDYWTIQRYGQIPVLYGAEKHMPLHTMGFWNLMAAYLSHNALSKVRELGAFYHLIPENPNAAEWLTWWMRQISISSHLEGVFGGMQSVIEKLLTAMGIPANTKGQTILTNDARNLTIRLGATVTALKKDGDTIKISLPEGKEHPEAFNRVILALPTVPAEKLTQNSPDLWDLTDPRDLENKKRFTEYLHSALPFQLLKAFFIVRDRWWEEDVRANLGATRYPTREVYFWKSRMKDSRRGLVMLYTDRPAAAFWANYIPGPTQEDIDELCRKEPSDAVGNLRARIKSRFVEYVNDNEGQKIKPDDIIWCGIMDWGREPYDAASHAWRPNREYWNTLADLADWQLGTNGNGPHLHVCGEAYSDYHAFIEGALRSAVHVLTQIGSHEQLIESKIELAGAQASLKRIRLAGIIGKLFESYNDKVDKEEAQSDKEEAKFAFGRVTACIDGTEFSGEKVEDKDLTPDEKYVKDFLDWSGKLDSIREANRKALYASSLDSIAK
jgi:hypothetical protein